MDSQSDSPKDNSQTPEAQGADSHTPDLQASEAQTNEAPASEAPPNEALPSQAQPAAAEQSAKIPESAGGRIEELLRQGNLELLMDVELGVRLRFGSRQATLREILELGTGAVLELDREIEDPVDLLLNEKVIARGEVVVIDGNYGLRVTEVASPHERVGSL